MHSTRADEGVRPYAGRAGVTVTSVTATKVTEARMMGHRGIADIQARNKQHHLIDRSGDWTRKDRRGTRRKPSKGALKCHSVF